MMETIFIVPMLMLLTFGILQIAQLFIARQVVGYAAYCAARATLSVADDEEEEYANQAARRVLCWLVSAPSTKKDGVQMPDCDSEEVAKRIIDLDIREDNWNKTVILQFAFPMTVPFASQVLGYGMDLQTYAIGSLKEHYQELFLNGHTVPHAIFTERCTLTKPYKQSQDD